MSLGDYVRVCRVFVEVFKWASVVGERERERERERDEEGEKESKDHVEYRYGGNTSGSEGESEETARLRCMRVNALRNDLKVEYWFFTLFCLFWVIGAKKILWGVS